MKFKQWLNELTNLDPLAFKLLQSANFSADDMLYFERCIPFIYCGINDKLFANSSVRLHHDLVRLLPTKEYQIVDKVLDGDSEGIIGRVGLGKYFGNHPEGLKELNIDIDIVSFYVMGNFTENLSKRSVEHLLNQKFIDNNSYVAYNKNVYSVSQYLGKESQEVSDEAKLRGSYQVALHLGAWPNGKRLTKEERDFIMDKLGITRQVAKKPWQNAAEKAGVIQPGQKLWAPTSEVYKL